MAVLGMWQETVYFLIKPLREKVVLDAVRLEDSRPWNSRADGALGGGGIGVDARRGGPGGGSQGKERRAAEDDPSDAGRHRRRQSGRLRARLRRVDFGGRRDRAGHPRAVPSRVQGARAEKAAAVHL